MVFCRFQELDVVNSKDSIYGSASEHTCNVPVFLRHLLAGLCCLVLWLAGAGKADAQTLAVKTNLLYDATATVNIGAEVALAPKWTLDVSGNYNAWDWKDNRKWRHFLVQPEARYWLCEKFNGHFFGLHIHGGQFNAGNVSTPFGLFGDCRNTRHEGWYYGAGVSYGYQWILGKRWNLELDLGVGYVGSDYDMYENPVCGAWLGTDHHDYFGITKASVSIIFMIF